MKFYSFLDKITIFCVFFSYFFLFANFFQNRINNGLVSILFTMDSLFPVYVIYC